MMRACLSLVCVCTALLFLLFTFTTTVQGGLLIKDGGKKGQIIVFGKSCMPTVIKTGGKKGKQLILMPGNGGGNSGQGCGNQRGSSQGYGSSGSSSYGGGGSYGSGGHDMSSYSSPMMMMPSSSADMYSQMMTNMLMSGMMMSAGYGSGGVSGGGMMMMPVYSKFDSSGMSNSDNGRGHGGDCEMNSYGAGGNRENYGGGSARPMNTNSAYQTGQPMMGSENRGNGGGQYEGEMNDGGSNDHDSGNGQFSMGGNNNEYGREFQNDDQHQQPATMHLNIVDDMPPEEKALKRKRSWQKKADEEMMNAMTSMLVRSRLQPALRHRPHHY